MPTGIDLQVRRSRHSAMSSAAVNVANGGVEKKGMILPFQPLALTFDSVSYYVDMPAVSSKYVSLLLTGRTSNNHLYI